MVDDELIEVGRVVKAHGLRGQLVVRPAADGSDVLLHVEEVTLERPGGERTRFVVHESRFQVRQIALALAGIADRTAAERWIGSRVLLAESELPPPAEDEFYIGDLVGLSVVSPTGERYGTVVDLESSPVQEWLVVEGAKGRSLVPLTEGLCRVELDQQRVVVDAPEGLFDGEEGGSGPG